MTGKAAAWLMPVLLAVLAAGCAAVQPAAQRPSDRLALEQARRQALQDEARIDTRDAEAGLAVDDAEALQPYRQPGDGARIAQRLPSISQWQTEGTGIAFNFQNAEIRSVAASVLGEALGLDYVIAPGVEGRISLQTSEAVPREAVLMAFESALNAVGVYLIEDQGSYRLVRAGDVGALGAPPVVGLSSRQLRAGFGLHVVPVQFVSAPRLAELVTPFVSASASVRADAVRNLLLISGTGRERQSLIDLVSVFDVDWMRGLSYGLFPLEASQPEPVAEELALIFARDEDDDTGAVRILPIERLNAVLVIAPSAILVDRAADWVARLDQGGGAGGKRLYVYNVQNGRARDLAEVLGGIFGAEEQTAQTDLGVDSVAPGLRSITQTATPGGVADTPTSQGSIGGTGGEGLDLAAEPARAARPPERVAFVSDRLRLIGDDRNNALVILATPQDYQLIRSSLTRLDVPPLQVLIEATIAEVQLTDELQYGIQWFFEQGDFDVSLGNLSTAAAVGGFPGFVGQFTDDDAQIIISALDQVTDVEVVSSPQLLVLNNQTALLQVGDEVPIPVSSFVDVDNPDTIANQIEFRSTGVILRVTPRVNAGGMVQLDVEQEVSDVTPTASSGIDAPTIQQRRLASTVAVRSGATVALGGLIEDSLQRTNAGIPLLKDIPLLGHLFKSTTTTTERSELLVLITPRVIANHEEAMLATEELRRRMRSLAPPEY
ncbi:MAG: type II secretion system secretin GspD [Rhodothalassiaceae bacterium]